MALTDQKFSFEHLLSHQLKGFSQLTESLTFRILELEERISSLEESFASADLNVVSSTKELLAESELKVRHLKDLLKESQSDSLKSFNESVENECVSLREQEIVLEDDQSKASFDEEELSDQDESFDDGENLRDTEYIDDPQTSLLSA